MWNNHCVQQGVPPGGVVDRRGQGLRGDRAARPLNFRGQACTGRSCPTTLKRWCRRSCSSPSSPSSRSASVRPLRRWLAIVLGAALMIKAPRRCLVAYRGEPFFLDRAFSVDGCASPISETMPSASITPSPSCSSAPSPSCSLSVLYQRLARARYHMSTLMEIALALMAGGLLGILLDRIRLKYVVDFLEFGPERQLRLQPGRLVHYARRSAGVDSLWGVRHLRADRPPPSILMPPMPVRRNHLLAQSPTSRQTSWPRLQIFALCAASAHKLCLCMWPQPGHLPCFLLSTPPQKRVTLKRRRSCTQSCSGLKLVRYLG